MLEPNAHQVFRARPLVVEPGHVRHRLAKVGDEHAILILAGCEQLVLFSFSRLTHLSKKQGHGFIFGEDACRVYFEKKALSGLHMQGLFIGSNVEYRVRYGPRIEATEVSRGRPGNGSGS